MRVTRLGMDDYAQLEQFLRQHRETSLFILGNMNRVGLAQSDQAYHGDYWGLFQQEELSGVLVHYWNGNVMMQAPNPEHLTYLIHTFQKTVKRPIAGILGVVEQADQVITALGLHSAQFRLQRAEQLYALDLSQLIIPALAAELELKVVHPRAEYRELLQAWLRAYELEALHAQAGAALERRVAATVEVWLRSTEIYLLEVNQQPVALSGFSVNLPDIVQVGPVWTPPSQRNRAYARYLVAQSLATAKERGVQTAILFTDTPAAIKAYTAIGFRLIGQYRLALLREPQLLASNHIH